MRVETGGLFARKANVSSVWDRLCQTREDADEEEETTPSQKIVVPDLFACISFL